MKKINKPWGHYLDIVRTKWFVLKWIRVEKDEALSLQLHKKRYELWYVFGNGLVENGYKKYRQGGWFWIKPDILHRISSVGEKLGVLELQFGVCDEKDIARYDDKYGRYELEEV
jgi:mannose-6-phosphate isomerase-like protein (cupin superfamily)